MPNDSTNTVDRAAARPVTVDNDAAKESLLGTERGGRPSNVSWGSIVAGVVTFLAVTVLLNLVTAGIGLGGSGMAAGIWSIIALAIALAAAGFVAGALAVRSGLLHGFLTWATSLVVALALTVWLSTSLLGAVGGALSSATEALSGTDVTQVVEDVQGNVDEEEAQQQADEAAAQAEQVAEDAAAATQAASWWGFVGLLIGAVIAALGGMLGVRAVVNREREHDALTVRAPR